VLASQIDLLEDPCLLNVVILQTVLQEIRHRSAPVYKRLRDIISTPQKHFYAFTNEHHRSSRQSSVHGTRIDASLLLNCGTRWRLVAQSLIGTVSQCHEGQQSWWCSGVVHKAAPVQMAKDWILALRGVGFEDVVESRVIFPEHLPLSQLQQGVRSGRFVQGTFLVSRENYLEGTLRVRGDGDSDKEVLIQGLQHLNRAMHDDIVCVEMFPEERWVAPSSLVLHDEGVAGDVAEENEEDVVSGASTLPTIRSASMPWAPWCTDCHHTTCRQTPREICAVWVPMYQWKRDTGDCGDKETETEVLLLEHDVPHQPFSQAVLACLPPPTFSITAEVRMRRVTICQFIDCGVLVCSGVHVRILYAPDNRQMRKHPPSSSSCSQTSIVSRCLACLEPMMHEAWVNTMHKQVFSTQISEFVKCLILRFCVVLAGHDNRSCPFSTRRALTLASPEVRFHMDSETHDPIDLQTKELKETNSMVEEFMLLANISVAERIVDEFPECALLRRHPAPPPSNYDILVKAAKSKNIEIQVDSAKALAESLDRAAVPGAPPYLNTLLRILATRCMMQAIYFCSGMEPDTNHYGLATAIYTHFTSPIRRCSGVRHTREIDLREKQQQLCNNLNYRHKMAQYAQRSSVAFHTQLFFKSKGVVSEEGFVLFVRKNAVVVLIPKYGLEGTVFFDSKDLKLNVTFDEEVSPTLCVEGIALNMFDRVCVRVSLDSSNLQHQRIRMHLVRPEV
uniref:DIS3 exosome endoribonuclease and 3'-5' exoribonuclease n=1 Tax=Petromyzon marinus TaxID=7757 RepID=S4RRK4_PETMA